MAYCAVDDIKALLPEADLLALCDDENLGSIEQTRVDEAIAQADAEIDSYCGGRYGVPITPVPPVLKKLSVDITIYNLYSRIVQTMPEVRSDRYRNAIKQLEGVAKGLISLGVAEAPEPADTGSGSETNKPTDTSVFSRDKLGGF